MATQELSKEQEDYILEQGQEDYYNDDTICLDSSIDPFHLGKNSKKFWSINND